MTIAAWDGKTLAVDRIGTLGGWTYATRKLHLFPRQRIAFAFAGSLSVGAEVARWIGRGMRRSEFPEVQGDDDRNVDGLVVIDGQLFELDSQPTLVPILAPFHARGSGRDFALAAMALGHDAVAAVELASQLCTTCGKGVDWAECR